MKPSDDIGPALVEARAKGEAWKHLCARFGYGRTRLWMLWREALAANKSVHEHLAGGQSPLPRQQ